MWCCGQGCTATATHILCQPFDWWLSQSDKSGPGTSDGTGQAGHGYNTCAHSELSCYKPGTQQSTYDDAKAACDALDATLAVPNTSSENSWLATLSADDSSMWIGYDQTGAACPLGWMSREDRCYQRQGSARSYDAAVQVCATFRSKIAVPNTQEENAFLSTAMNAADNPTTWIGYDHTGSSCGPGWATDDGFCYKMLDTTYMYDEAKLACEGLGAKLATPDTESENEFLAHMVAMACGAGYGLVAIEKVCKSSDGQVIVGGDNWPIGSTDAESKAACAADPRYPFSAC